MQVLSALERAALVWERHERAHHDDYHINLGFGGGLSDLDKAANARRVVRTVRVCLPGLGQTQLETAKLANNRDVGAAVLEAFSRVLESRIAGMKDLAGVPPSHRLPLFMAVHDRP